MKNNEYNTLKDMLIQSGILQQDLNPNQSEDINFFNAKNFDEINPVEIKPQTNSIKRKRLNNYDLELLEKADTNPQTENETKIQKIIYKFFPKLYEFKIAKNAIQKMTELGIDADSLMDKSVPYGEGEIRYKNLVKFIKYANEIQTKLKRKTK